VVVVVVVVVEVAEKIVVVMVVVSGAGDKYITDGRKGEIRKLQTRKRTKGKERHKKQKYCNK